MKDFLENRTPREKILLAISGAIFGIAMLYWLIWEPLVDSYTNLQKDIVYNQQLLSWMQEKQGVLLQGKKGVTPSSGQDLFLVIDESIKKSIIKEFKPEMLRLSENRVAVKFSQVPFDDLLILSSSLLTQYNADIDILEVSKLTEKANESGLVQANITYIR